MVKWRNSCPPTLMTRIENACEAQLYLLRQIGPTGFLIKEHESNAKYKVLLGEQHTCDCLTYTKEKELCVHILWIVIKKFRISKDNPIVYQLGLVERDLNSLIFGTKSAYARRFYTSSASSEEREDAMKQKIIEKEDLCPICQEDIFRQKTGLTFCKFGCGNSIHINCMKIWADHQYKSSKDETIKCPLCRSDFAPYKKVISDYKQHQRQCRREKLQNVPCYHCKHRITGSILKCGGCKNFFMCASCYHSNHHFEHMFLSKNHPNIWRRRDEKMVDLSPAISKFSWSSNASSSASSIALPRLTLLNDRPSEPRPRGDIETLGINGLGLDSKNTKNCKIHNPLKLPPIRKARKKRCLKKDEPQSKDFSELVVVSHHPHH